MCVMNLRRRSLRNRSANSKVSLPNVKISKRKSTNRSRRSFKVAKLDDSRNSFRKANVEITKNLECIRNEAHKPLLRDKGSKHPSHEKYDLHFDPCKDPLTSNSFSFPIKPQCETSMRKRKSTQQNYSIRNVSQIKKRKKSKSPTKGKEVFNSSEILNKITKTHNQEISDKNAAKSVEKSSDYLVSGNTTRFSPRLAARKNSENERFDVNGKNGQVSVSANILKDSNSNYSSSKTRVKRCETSLTSSKISRKSNDETFSYSTLNSDNESFQDKKTYKRNLKTVSNQKHLKQNSDQNLSRYSLRFSGNKTSMFDAESMKVVSNNISTIPSKITRSASKRTIKPKAVTPKLQTMKTTKFHLRRHTVPLRKTKKKWPTNRKNKNAVDATVNVKTPSNVDSQIGEFSYYLNNVPTDDINKIPFYSPNNVKRFGKKQEIIITSTPDLKKATKQQQAKNKVSCGSSRKSIPHKGSLKHKRLLIKSLKEKNEEYEDDLFENRSFGSFKNLIEFDDESDTSMSSIVTPKCPFLVTSCLPVKTPRFKDCYSPHELLKARKAAEEYMYRRNKKWKTSSQLTPYSKKKDSLESKNDEKILGSSASALSEKKKLDFMSIIEQFKRKNQELSKEKESDEDEYFSDVSS